MYRYRLHLASLSARQDRVDGLKYYKFISFKWIKHIRFDVWSNITFTDIIILSHVTCWLKIFLPPQKVEASATNLNLLVSQLLPFLVFCIFLPLIYRGLFEMIVGVLATCHTQYTWARSICIFLFNRTTLQVFVTYLTVFLYLHPLWFYKHQHDNLVRSKLFVACQHTIIQA
jgi:hypothetical protein